MKTLADGLHPNVHRDSYDKLERVNFSTLKLLGMKSPAHYRHHLVTPTEDTDPKRLGRVVHVAAFEPERFKSVIAVWDGAARRGKDWERFCEENRGRELLTENQRDACAAIQKSVKDDATAQKYLQRGGRGEVTMCWTREIATEFGAVVLNCKGRIDFDGDAAIVDLKSTRDSSPSGFGRQAFSMRYHTQSAWYSDAYEHITGLRKPYVIVAVENVPPYVVQVYTVPDQVLQLGRDEYTDWLNRLAFHRATSTWPGYWDGERELELPRWSGLGGDDEDLSGIDLQIGGKTHGQGLPLDAE